MDATQYPTQAATPRASNGFSAHDLAQMGNLSAGDEARRAWGLPYHAYPDRFMNPQMRNLSDSSARWQDGHFYEWIGRADQVHALVHPIWWYEQLTRENV